MKNPARFRSESFILILFVGALFSGCGLRKDVVATVGPEVITAGDVLAMRDRFRQMAPGAPDSPFLRDRRALLNPLIRDKVLAVAARKAGVSLTVVNMPAGESLDRIYASQYQQKLMADLRPTDQEVRAFYEINRAHYDQPRERAHIIFVHTIEKAKQAQAQLALGTPFEEVAKDVMGLKEGPAMKVAVEPKSFRKGDRLPEFERAFFALQPGQTSGILETNGMYQIIQREQPETNLPYAAIQEEIREGMTQQKYEKKVAELTAATPIKVNEKALADLQF
jgi:hypothetical protein